MYDPPEPHASGMLDVGDGQQLYGEVRGNPTASRRYACTEVRSPAAARGSPRSSTPAAYRIVLIAVFVAVTATRSEDRRVADPSVRPVLSRGARAVPGRAAVAGPHRAPRRRIRRLLPSPDPQVRSDAAAAWCAWEEAIVALADDTPPNPRNADPPFRYGFARTVTHYFSHAGF